MTSRNEEQPSPRRQFLRSSGLVIAAGGAGYLASARGSVVQPESEVATLSGNEFFKSKFKEGADEIYRRHFSQTKAQAVALKAKYQNPVFGEMDVIDAFEKLVLCVDPTDTTLIHTNQLIHTLQVLEGMEQDGIVDPDMLFAAAVHDLGKLLLLTDEQPENIVCGNRPIGSYRDKVGLDNVVFQWNHDEFIYDRLKEYVPDHVAWLIRYHSIDFPVCEHLMNEYDRALYASHLQTFRKYDQHTKSTTHLPQTKIQDYGDLLKKYLPGKIVI
ncbi:MAG: inositol oxygenase family protein [Pseudomonadota bacterium]